MKEVKKLESAFKEHLGWQAQRVSFLVQFLIAVILARTVNLAELAEVFAGKANTESKYKRLKRFFSSFAIDFKIIAELIIHLLPAKDSWVLTLDRTNWKFGKKNINPLVLGIAYKGIAFPIFWITFSKKGNSNTQERIGLIERFVTTFGIERIKCITADREFIGQEWFGCLLYLEIMPRIRIKENTLVTNSRGQLVPARDLFRGLKPGEVRILEGERLVFGFELFVIGTVLPTGEYLIIVTGKEPETAMTDYAERWEIETLFGCLKSRGFRFESTYYRR
ncbi:MAG: IS4 family transposase [Deltaproteobacteria bacterium]|nr:IS4 family transposase [Deltaproteobacteria bacterium]MBF0524014.1 IS4 family transposase [Deltaproteobacteria bacterium]